MKKLLAASALAVAVAPSVTLADGHGEYTFALVPKAMNNPFFDLARDGCYRPKKNWPT